MSVHSASLTSFRISKKIFQSCKKQMIVPLLQNKMSTLPKSIRPDMIYSHVNKKNLKFALLAFSSDSRQDSFKGESSVSESLIRTQDRNLLPSEELGERLSSCTDTEQVLDLVEIIGENVLKTNRRLLLDIVEKLFDSMKLEKSDQDARKKDYLYSVGMQKVSRVLRHNVRFMELPDLINCVKLLSFLRAPSNHKTLQMALQCISKQANSLELQQIVYLSFLLKRFRPNSKSSISRALEMALPVVFETQLPIQVDDSKISDLCTFLHYAEQHQLSDSVVTTLINCLNKISFKLKPDDTLSILWSLAGFKNSFANEDKLTEACFAKISEAVNQISISNLCITISKCSRKYLNQCYHFYDECFIEEVCRRLIEPDVPPEALLLSLKHFSILKHINIEYMDKVGEIVCRNPALVLNSDFVLSSLVRSFANSNYKPENWQTVIKILEEHPFFSKDLERHSKEDIGSLDLCLDFLNLGGYPGNLVKKIFSPLNLSKLEALVDAKAPYAITLLRLHYGIQVFHKEYDGPLLPEGFVEKCLGIVENSFVTSYPLQGALEAALGGSPYVLTKLYHQGIHIDHAIVMRQGGYPVAVNSQAESESSKAGLIPQLDDVAKPENSTIVLIKAFTNESYANNTRRLRGYPTLEVRHLEQLNYSVIVIDVVRWKELNENEKIPYLMRLVKEKTDKLKWNQNIGDVIPS